MKICYIWIEKFRNFNDFGFNLSNSVKIKFNSEDGVLSQNSLINISPFFFGKKIEDVIGLIGKNGSGKSNAISLICKTLKNARTKIQSDFLIITEENSNFTCHYSFNERSKPKANFDIEFKEYEGSIDPLKVVFFSNVFDEKRNNFGRGVSDISVNNTYGKSFFYKKNRESEFEKQISFINSKLFESLNINFPDRVRFTSRLWKKSNYSSSMEHRYFRERSKQIKDFQGFYKERLREIKPENKFIYLIRFCFFFEIIFQIFKFSRIDEKTINLLIKSVAKHVDSLYEYRTEEISERLILFLEKYILGLSSELDLQINIKQSVFNRRLDFERLPEQIKYLKFIKDKISGLKIDFYSEGGGNRVVENFSFNYYSSRNRRFINEFIHLFSSLNIFDIDWQGISSGHKAYINLFSSLYKELRYARTKNLLLCIDEGDLYLHPKWQVEFFDKLITVLPQIYNGSIQLVLTSHSPFLLSDLPNQCLTILGSENEISSLDGIELPIKTFGANLYDLYAEPFFLGNKRTSDFAYKKTKEIIDKIEFVELTNFTKIYNTHIDSFKKLVELIGDDIIRHRLLEMLKK